MRKLHKLKRRIHIGFCEVGGKGTSFYAIYITEKRRKRTKGIKACVMHRKPWEGGVMLNILTLLSERNRRKRVIDMT